MPQFYSEAAETIGQQLDDFTAAYVYALYFTDTDPNSHPSSDLEMPNSEAELSPSALASIIADCNAFKEANADLLAQACDRAGYGDLSQAGHDFWLTRNGHGAGFWDRAALTTDDLGDRLTAACKAFGECWVTLGDDGLIYLD